jgi:hypothetical protein
MVLAAGYANAKVTATWANSKAEQSYLEMALQGLAIRRF